VIQNRILPFTGSTDLLGEVHSNGLGLFVNGEQREALDRSRFESIDPFSAEPWYTAADASPEDVEHAVENAWQAFTIGPWAKMAPFERAEVLHKIAAAVEVHSDQIGVMDAFDTGKLFRETRSQAREVARSLRYYAGLADKHEGTVPQTDAREHLALTLREPYGVIAITVPSNSPLPLLIVAAAPALAAGNTVVVKTSEFASASVVKFAEIAVANGLPPGVLNVITGAGARAGVALNEHPKISKIVFTGGNVVGQRIAAAAAKRSVPVMLELGGKSPQLVFSDADIDRVVKGLIGGIFAAAGQTCVAGGRALIHESIYEEVVARFVSATASIELGDPLDARTQMGPLSSPVQLDSAIKHVDLAKAEGASLLAGGNTRPTGVGHGVFFEPTVFGNVKPTSHLFQEEVFGPIIGFTAFESDDEAIRLANQSRYGLAAGVWTGNLDRALTVGKAIQAGTVWVNTYRAPQVTVPSGGYKESGYGRLKGSRALYEFTREKSLIINHSGVAKNPFVMHANN
jgi:acyl-CoA reductase-like NAD-dependent aldehyde dehydrogenase